MMISDSAAYGLLVRTHLQAELERFNLPDLKVQNNHILVGKSGQTYQIDITFEFTLAGGIGFLVLAECKPYQRKSVKVEDIETLHHQVIDIGAHKGVLITSTGYQRTAVNYAKAHGITLITAVGPEHALKSHTEPRVPPIAPVVTQWSNDKNARRCQLIDKDIQGTIDDREKRELKALTEALRRHRKHIAPRSLDMLKKLHQDLLQKPPEQDLDEAHNMLSVLQNRDATLQQLQSAKESRQAEASPTQVDWKTSITKHAVRCLECGASFKQLSTRHLRLHGMDGRSYREKYGIPRTQSLTTHDVLARRREITQ